MFENMALKSFCLSVLVHLSSLEVDSYQSKACLDDERGFVDGIGWSDGMVFKGHRYSKSTFGANNCFIVL